ncbi:MAG TPA: hypothetical protein VGR95_01425, partial [Thermoanaerobaculia bacterium]|nr:hypothetical protein [Thermoanaerobaculia bacterium]
MRNEIVDGVDGLERIADRWEALWRRDPNATPFQSPQWLLPWWKHFGSDTPHVIAQTSTASDGSLDALAPLYILRDEDSGESLGMFLGTGNSDYLDVLQIEGGDASLLIDSITRADCQLWDLQQLRPSSSLLSVPLPDGWSDNVEDQDPCPVLPIENAGEELQNLLSTHARKKLRYFRRCLEREGDVRYENATAESLDTLLDALYELHAARWQ